MSEGGASTITFLPYLAERFAKEYIIGYYVGESFSALIPGVLALSQGVGDTQSCANQANTQIKPNYPVLVYFMLIFAILCLGILAFSLLNCAPFVKKHHKKQKAVGIAMDDKPYEYETVAAEDAMNPAYEKVILFSMMFVIMFFFFG